jgi:hypothetical protein
MNSGKSYKISCDTVEIKLAMVRGLEVNYIGSDSGYAAIEIPDEKPKIKMTKTLPTEAGFYYNIHSWGDSVQIAEIELRGAGLICFIGDNSCGIGVGDVGGYWAKVDQSMFEFEGE